MINLTQEKWDNHYRDRVAGSDLPASRVLGENQHLLPTNGRGLELACGLAANAFTLARSGLEVDAWDISTVAIERVEATAKAMKLAVTGAVRDVMQSPIPENSYDVIVVSHFLERDLVPQIVAGLKTGGLLFYQTFTQTKVSEGGPGNDAWRLADGELLALFSDLAPLVYREEGCVGDTTRGFRNEAMLVARKR